MQSIYLALREYRGCFKANFWCAMLLLFYFKSIHSVVLKWVIRYFEITKMNRLWLTPIFLYRFYKAYIPELRLRLASGVDCVETNPAPSCD